MFDRGLAAVAEPGRPSVAGAVINMLPKDAASARAYEGRLAGDAARRVLGTAITRSDAFDEAASAATPVRMHGSEASRKMRRAPPRHGRSSGPFPGRAGPPPSPGRVRKLTRW